MANGKRVEIIPETDSRYILLRIDRTLLVLLVVVLALIATVHTFGIVQSIKSDDRLVRETVNLGVRISDANEVIENANDVSEASVEFWRCAFLIEPDVKKTPKVIDACVEKANFPVRQKSR